MPRPLEFDPDAALEKAMQVFWVNGIAQTSVNDLVAATGVQRSGLYNVFGSKDGLFQQAMDLYIRTVVQVNFGAYFDDPACDIETLKRYFSGFERIFDHPMAVYGCLMCNTAISKSKDAQSVDVAVDAMLSQIIGYFQSALANSRRAGRLVSHRSDHDLARLMLGHVIALSTLCRSAQGQKLVDSYVRGVLDELAHLEKLP